MTAASPDWLALHHGELHPAYAADEWIIFFDGKQQYWLEIVPAQGKFGCKITQSINGAKIPNPAVCDSPNAALQAGLDVLRKSLGW